MCRPVYKCELAAFYIIHVLLKASIVASKIGIGCKNLGAQRVVTVAHGLFLTAR